MCFTWLLTVWTEMDKVLGDFFVVEPLGQKLQDVEFPVGERFHNRRTAGRRIRRL